MTDFLYSELMTIYFQMRKQVITFHSVYPCRTLIFYYLFISTVHIFIWQNVIYKYSLFLHALFPFPFVSFNHIVLVVPLSACVLSKTLNWDLLQLINCSVLRSIPITETSSLLWRLLTSYGSLLLWLMIPPIGSPTVKNVIFPIIYPPCLLPVLC